VNLVGRHVSRRGAVQEIGIGRRAIVQSQRPASSVARGNCDSSKAIAFCQAG
jgi:hypothetical protein